MKATVGNDVVDALQQRFGPIEHIGSGAWSTAFRFTHDGDAMVVRVGAQTDDFERDAEMAKFAAPGLPIPAVSEISQLSPPHDDLHLCVSTFAPGVPLEHAAKGNWIALVPVVADLLATMRKISPPPKATVVPWPEVLCAEPDDAAGRMMGWRDQLALLPVEQAVYTQARAALVSLCETDAVARVEPTLLHCDLINRNVHVEHGRITGVFDWGCQRWGDHLFELAWFIFFDRWMDTLDSDVLRHELVSRWGHEPHEDRLRACLLQIGADHLIYNASIGDAEACTQVASRIDELRLLTD